MRSPSTARTTSASRSTSAWPRAPRRFESTRNGSIAPSRCRWVRERVCVRVSLTRSLRLTCEPCRVQEAQDSAARWLGGIVVVFVVVVFGASAIAQHAVVGCRARSIHRRPRTSTTGDHLVLSLTRSLVSQSPSSALWISCVCDAEDPRQGQLEGDLGLRRLAQCLAGQEPCSHSL